MKGLVLGALLLSKIVFVLWRDLNMLNTLRYDNFFNDAFYFVDMWILECTDRT